MHYDRDFFTKRAIVDLWNKIPPEVQAQLRAEGKAWSLSRKLAAVVAAAQRAWTGPALGSADPTLTRENAYQAVKAMELREILASVSAGTVLQ